VSVLEDFDACYRAVQSRDARFDGWFFTAVTSTHIYCRPSCPAKTPKPENVRFYPTAAAAQQAGFRACLRCRPDAAPGSPAWLGRADVAARAVKLILDGAVDREGVSGLASRLGYSERQLHRVLLAEVGTGALSLARAQRAQTARVLLQSTNMPITQVAFGAGFSSVRQFNETVRAVFARTPTELRRASKQRPRDTLEPGQAIPVRLAHRIPMAGQQLFDFLGQRAILGIESYDGHTYRRSLRLPHGNGTVTLRASDTAGQVRAVFVLDDLRDLTSAVARSRQLLNLDADPVAVDEALSSEPLLSELVTRTPGIRVAGSADAFELAIRAIVGQQITVAGARTVVGALVHAAGEPIRTPLPGVTHAFPTPDALAELARAQPSAFKTPASRRRTIEALSQAVASGSIALDPSADPAEVERDLLALPGIGPWTAGYIAMRALADPDAFLANDLGVRQALQRLNTTDDPRAVANMAESWRPWRAYATVHLWHTLAQSARLPKPQVLPAPRTIAA
jgi:AraC family transcriptional regulator, regulatory protein of adaptative response / DNA-3-methyladenine glycosylase II